MNSAEAEFGRFQFAVDIAFEVRKALLPCLADTTIKTATKVAHSGDTTFRIDIVAEEAFGSAVERSNERLAYFSEDRGLVMVDPNPDWLLIADPIDGTRPLMCGLEWGVVSIAVCPFSQNAVFGDILAGIILEINSGELYFAEKDQGVRMNGARTRRIRPSSTTELNKMFWSFDTVGRPSKWTFRYLGDLLDLGLDAGAFIFINAAWSLLRIATGELDAHIEIGGRALNEHPESEADFESVAHGRIMGAFPYDIAAAYMILKEANCSITDAYGEDLSQRPMVAHGKGAVLSFIAASNKHLHRQIVQYLEDLN